MLLQHASNINRENLAAVHLLLLVLPCPVSFTAFSGFLFYTFIKWAVFPSAPALYWKHFVLRSKSVE